MGKEKIIGFVFLFMFMFSLAFVSSAPPTTTITDYQRGVDIIHPETQIIKYNEDLEFNFWTYNVSNGATLTNTSLNCTLYIVDNTGNQYYRFSNQAGANGLITYGKGAPLCINCWTMTLPKENISLGVYSYQTKCQGLQIGGYTTGFFEVTSTGKEFTDAESRLSIAFLLIFIFLFLVTMGAITFLDDKRFSTNDEGKIMDRGMIAYLKPVLYVVAYSLLLATMFLASNIALAYLSSVMFGNILFTIYRVMFILAPILFILWIIFIFVRIFDDKETKLMFERGLGYGDL